MRLRIQCSFEMNFKNAFAKILFFLIFSLSCKSKPAHLHLAHNNGAVYQPLFQANPSFRSDGFDFPVGKPNAKGYYNARKFTEVNHLGEDWNGKGGGDTDLGDPIYAIANGYVVSCVEETLGWGKIIRIVHQLNDSTFVESFYAHCQDFVAQPKTFVKRGDKIATIGNANGIYLAHLHFELRDEIDKPVGGGYSKNTTGYLNPTEFINANRP
jgi:murein DD-endopeptidase MepM/ murein hydrolase activator NlpD